MSTTVDFVNIDPQGPNAQQIKFWNEEAGPRWIRLHRDLSAHIRPLGEKTMARIPELPQGRVLDIGCGCGDTTLHMAKRLGPEALVVGVDISEPMLNQARIYAQEENIGHARFEHADAQTADLGEKVYDAMISRFGVMFFSDPVKAFQNIHRALKPMAPMAFVCWRSLGENPWLSMSMQVLAQHVTLPRMEPHAPGPFAFADGERLKRLLAEAGFKDVILEAVDETLLLAGRPMELEEAVEFMLQLGPGVALLRDANDALRAKVRSGVQEALRPYYSEEGLRMPAAAWLVTARAGL